MGISAGGPGQNHVTKNPETRERIINAPPALESTEVNTSANVLSAPQTHPPIPRTKPTMPIPAEDNSNEEDWFDEEAFFKETNPTTVTPDDDIYFNETNDANTHNGDFNSCNEDSDADSDTNNSDSNSDDEYDHELNERLQSEEMARLAKLEDKTPTKPTDDDFEVNDDYFEKIFAEGFGDDKPYFDDDGDPIPQGHFSERPIIAPVTA